jgi:hypothetical protein
MAREFRKPDLNAPRYRPKVYNVLSKDLLKAFKEKHPQYKDLTYSTFKHIISKANEKIRNSIIEFRDGVELPESLGYIFIGSCSTLKKGRENIDYGKSIKAGTKISNINWDSDGLLGKIFYTNYAVKYKVSDRQIWNFVPCRQFKRSVAKAYPESWTKYLKVANTLRVSKLYHALTAKDYREAEDKNNMEFYNEFDI